MSTTGRISTAGDNYASAFMLAAAVSALLVAVYIPVTFRMEPNLDLVHATLAMRAETMKQEVS